MLSLKSLLWIDAIAALFSGCIVLILKNPFSRLFNLPENLLITLSVVALGYSSFSFYLTQQRSPSKQLLNILVLGNSTYALACVVLLIIYFHMVSLLGVGYFLLDFLFVATLAVLEWRQLGKRSEIIISGKE
jgi:hypothetical protein